MCVGGKNLKQTKANQKKNKSHSQHIPEDIPRQAYEIRSQNNWSKSLVEEPLD